ncbi:hypothetical protein [Pantoea agglomerans]|uniref:hypothetical protein n=1 Tax=Enterobacter agglomerans TaxID=549 RepID=UPI000B79E099|nr:hypothetical protein [Pantoea agglomerans]OXH80188.1 hypothetical protein CBI57_02510 [Pantoea agglomerans]
MSLDNLGLNARLSAQLDLKPQRNHIAVFLCIAGSFFLTLLTCLFVWFEKNGFIYPLVAAILFGIAGFYFFLITYRGGALADTAPFEVKEDESGTYIKMHPSLFSSDRDFANVLTLMAHTKPLPKASGLVNKNGEIIPDSAMDAVKVVEAANASVGPTLRKNIEGLKTNSGKIINKQYVEEPYPDVFNMNQADNKLPHDIQP